MPLALSLYRIDLAPIGSRDPLYLSTERIRVARRSSERSNLIVARATISTQVKSPRKDPL